jgi:hypothetical protein
MISNSKPSYFALPNTIGEEDLWALARGCQRQERQAGGDPFRLHSMSPCRNVRVDELTGHRVFAKFYQFHAVGTESFGKPLVQVSRFAAEVGWHT